MIIRSWFLERVREQIDDPRKRGFPVDDDTAIHHRGKAQSGWQHGVYLLPVDLLPRRGVLTRGKIFIPRSVDKPLREGWKISSRAKYPTRRGAKCISNNFRYESVRQPSNYVGMIDGRERSRPAIINKNKSYLIRNASATPDFLSFSILRTYSFPIKFYWEFKEKRTGALRRKSLSHLT